MKMETKYYSLWYLPDNRWTNAYFQGTDASLRGGDQDPKKPFLLSLAQATAWRARMGTPENWEVHEVSVIRYGVKYVQQNPWGDPVATQTDRGWECWYGTKRYSYYQSSHEAPQYED